MRFRFLFFNIFISFILISQTKTEIRVEPANWWAGMNHSQLEILVYGKNIQSWVASSTDILITGVKRTENPNYLFIKIETKGKNPGKYKINFNQGKKLCYTLDYELKKRSEGSSLRQGFNTSDVIYLIMPDRFCNGNEENDEVAGMLEKPNRSFDGGRHGGDIQGIISKLDYLQDLGVTALWSTPLCEDNDSIYSYHGYAQSDVSRIDPRYGNHEDYLNLANELHKRDMKLIMDYVTNHWGLKHWMIKDLPTYDWIHQFPGYGQTNYRMTTQFDPHTSEKDALYCMDGWFVKTMPDLNHKNEMLLRYLVQNAIWWIETYGIDGLRVDTYSFGHKEAMSFWTTQIMKEYPLFNIVGEVWLHNQAQIAYWQKDSKIGAIQNFNSGLPCVMDFTFHDAVSTSFAEKKDGWSSGMLKFYDNFVNDFLYSEANNMLIFLENHDTPRFNELYPAFTDYRLALSLLLTQRGIPQLYYGSEIGMRGKKDIGDGDIRQDFPGGWNTDKKSAFLKSDRTKEQEQYFSFTKKILNWRRGNEVISKGSMLQFVPEKNVYVYFRIFNKQTVMVIINNSQEEQTLDLSRFSEVLGNNVSALDIISENLISLDRKYFKVAASTPMILELK
jgi:neopullulanase